MPAEVSAGLILETGKIILAPDLSVIVVLRFLMPTAQVLLVWGQDYDLLLTPFR